MKDGGDLAVAAKGIKMSKKAVFNVVGYIVIPSTSLLLAVVWFANSKPIEVATPVPEITADFNLEPFRPKPKVPGTFERRGKILLRLNPSDSRSEPMS